MKIQKVNLKPHGFACICKDCGRTIHHEKERGKEKEWEERYVDLDGTPFNAYICTDCIENYETIIQL